MEIDGFDEDDAAFDDEGEVLIDQMDQLIDELDNESIDESYEDSDANQKVIRKKNWSG